MTKSLYITSVVTASGKTALALGLGLRMQAAGLKVGYLKPVSTQPFQVQSHVADEDADFARRILDLHQPPWELSPIVVNDELLQQVLKGTLKRDLSQDLWAAYDRAAEGKDVLLLEGGSTMREGYALGLNTLSVIEMLDVPTLAVVRYISILRLLDDSLAALRRIARRLLGVVINSVPSEAGSTVRHEVAPYLEGRGIRVYGVLPHQRQLMAISVRELLSALNAKVLTGEAHVDRLVETLSVGAMSVESALPRFRRQLNKAVITGGDRTDLQAAALDTSTACLILTGNLHPSPTIIKRAEEEGVPVLLATTNTLESIEAVERVFGKTRLGQPEKLNRFQASLAEHLDYARLVSDLGLG